MRNAAAIAPEAPRALPRAGARLAAGVARIDPRIWQIATLSTLLVLGVAVLRFDLDPLGPPLILASALAVQAIACRSLGLAFDPLSPTITALSLSLLLRADALWPLAAAAALAIGSKFVARIDGRHLFNPANIALVSLPLCYEGAWISPGQWGSTGLLAVALAGVGAIVAGRAARLDTTLAFLCAFAAATFARAFWLGDPMAIPLHQLQSGALLVFAFFMISDPATTPRVRPMRILHASAVALLGFALQTLWVSNAGPILALVLLAPLVPLLNRLAPSQAPNRASNHADRRPA